MMTHAFAYSVTSGCRKSRPHKSIFFGVRHAVTSMNANFEGSKVTLNLYVYFYYCVLMRHRSELYNFHKKHEQFNKGNFRTCNP